MKSSWPSNMLGEEPSHAGGFHGVREAGRFRRRHLPSKGGETVIASTVVVARRIGAFVYLGNDTRVHETVERAVQRARP